MFEEKYSPEFDYCRINFCCQIEEIGCWGGDPDHWDTRHATYEEAYNFIKGRQLKNNFLIATTLSTQRNARKALKDCGFTTVKSIPASDKNYRIFFHYWRNPRV